MLETPPPESTQVFVLDDDRQAWQAPAVVRLVMPPNYVLFRHTDICHRFEVVVQGSLEAGGRVLPRATS